MAAGTKLKMVFETGFGQKTWTFNYAKPDVTAQNVRTLAQVMIDNGTVYEYPPLQAVSASLETTTVSQLDLS